MNLLIKILAAFLILLLSKSFAQDCKGTIKIDTDTPSSIIFINDSLTAIGNTALQTEAGVYKIAVIRGGKNWDNIVFTDSVNLKCEEEKIFNYSFKSAVYLQTNPHDAGVFIGDSLIGHTPLYIPVTLKNLMLKKPDYETKIIDPAELTGGKTIGLNFVGRARKESFYEKNIFKYLVGGIVALGAATAYFKVKADKKFDEYQITGEPGLLNKTRKYDVISGITMGALQINFGALIYLFLVE